jgi:probable rRNA maturation factor
VSVLVDPAVRRRVSPALQRRIARRFQRMLRAAGLREGASLQASLLLTDDPTIHQLNKSFRRKDKPTDVLAFAQREGEGPVPPGLLGDVVISVDTARRQAGRGLERELLHLLAHGLCHLLGYDHKTDRQEREMNSRADALLAESARTGPTRPA